MPSSKREEPGRQGVLQSSVQGSMMFPSTAFRFWVTEARNVINSPVKVTTWEEGMISVFLPRRESALSTRDVPGGPVRHALRDPALARTYRHTEKATLRFRCCSLCQEKKGPHLVKGLPLFMNSSFSYTDQRRGQWPHLSQLFLTQIRRWQTFLDTITWMRVSKLLSSCSRSLFYK